MSVIKCLKLKMTIPIITKYNEFLCKNDAI